MHFTITRDGAEPAEIETIEMLSLVPDEIHHDTLYRVIKQGEDVRVSFTDGSAGILSTASRQRALVLTPPSDMHEFELDVRFLYEIEGKVVCLARDKRHAETLVQEVFNNGRSAPSTFHVLVDRAHMKGHFTELAHAFSRGDLTNLAVITHDVVINRVENRGSSR